MVPIGTDWVSVEQEDCSSLDKSVRLPSQTIPLTKRTQSSPFLDTPSERRQTDPMRKKNSIAMLQLMTEGCRSISDPDLTSCDDKERSSISSSEMDISEGTNPTGGILNGGTIKQRGSIGSTDSKRIRVRYSDNSLERSEVSKMIESLKKVSTIHMNSGENGTANYHNQQDSAPSTSSNKSKWNIKKYKGGKHKEGHKGKKNSKGFHSTEDILEQSSPMTGGREGEQVTRSTSDSPQDSQQPQQQHSPVPKRKNNTGIFKKKKKVSNAVPLHHSPSPQDDAFVKEGSTPPPSEDVGQISPTGLTAEDSGTSIGLKQVLGMGNHAPPTAKKEQPEGVVNFNLHTLVLPVNKNWTKCGYLWLRMKLPNGRYAWTHIVSCVCMSVCVCVCVCVCACTYMCRGQKWPSCGRLYLCMHQRDITIRNIHTHTQTHG